jgi:hypothetical protein
MKADELMIGDWVECVDSTHKKKVYAQIDAIEEGQTCILVRLDNCNWFLDISFIEPIPLTAEILEKNGFIRYGTSYILKESMFELTNPSNPDRYLDNYHIRFARQNKRVMYVHKLQHFMREFGIEKEIEL